MAPHYFFTAAFLMCVLSVVLSSGHKRQPLRTKSIGLYDDITSVGPFGWNDHRSWIMSSRNKRIRDTVKRAAKLAGNHCREMFQFDRWNCSTTLSNINFFRDGTMYRETAFMYALSAAALMHVTAQACTEGRLKRCACMIRSNNPHDRRCTENYNLKFARRFTRRFVQKKVVRIPLVNFLKRHNTDVGIQMAGQHKERCRCHGLSASCTKKICWKTIKPFKEIAEELKRNYYKAQQVEDFNTNRDTPLKDSFRDTFLYLNKSPDFCKTTRGRTCQDPKNCNELCCFRGYIRWSATKKRYCNCSWTSRFKLSCEVCSQVEESFTCK